MYKEVWDAAVAEDLASARGNNLTQGQLLFQTMGQFSDTFLEGFPCVLSVYMKGWIDFVLSDREIMCLADFQHVLVFHGKNIHWYKIFPVFTQQQK